MNPELWCEKPGIDILFYLHLWILSFSLASDFSKQLKLRYPIKVRVVFPYATEIHVAKRTTGGVSGPRSLIMNDNVLHCGNTP